MDFLRERTSCMITISVTYKCSEALSDFHKQQVANFFVGNTILTVQNYQEMVSLSKAFSLFFSSSIEVKKVENGLPGFNLLVFHVVVTKMATNS